MDRKTMEITNLTDTENEIVRKGDSYIYGDYVLTPCQNAFNNKVSYWLSKRNHTIAVYAFTPLNNRDLEKMVNDKKVWDSYISYFKRESDLDIPHADDPDVKVVNIAMFIKGYTSGDIWFQGDGAGRFYVKAGCYNDFCKNYDPANNGGVLIYSAETKGVDTNYVRAAHLANIMNFILAKTKGKEYGSEMPLFSDEPKIKGIGHATTMTPEIIKGFNSANWDDDGFYCGATGYAGYYYSGVVYSYNYHAVWFE